mmetsp:Transcript_144722/g.360788  ORF Transcript_144722/g.360788 Transcript_144722/m.360788 type:complete len:237 (-) Transcript_144722:200-910(-)
MGSNVADEPTATIVVMTIGGEAVCRFEAGSDISGLDIKRRVEELEGTAVNQQRLLVGGTLLSDTSQVDVADSAEVGVRLVRLPPSELVTIEGGQGRCVSVDEASGAIRPGPSFQWRMAAVDDGEFTFEAVGGPHAGKFISALEGKAYTKETELVLADLPETWRIVTSDQNRFYGWIRGGPFSIGIRSTRTAADEPGLFWRWQSDHYHLAEKPRDEFHGDEAYFIKNEVGSHTVGPC